MLKTIFIFRIWIPNLHIAAIPFVFKNPLLLWSPARSLFGHFLFSQAGKKLSIYAQGRKTPNFLTKILDANERLLLRFCFWFLWFELSESFHTNWNVETSCFLLGRQTLWKNEKFCLVNLYNLQSLSQITILQDLF